ncbi:MAG: pyridoxal phosphate-dependent aminotransferase [Deinococcales bacterium]
MTAIRFALRASPDYPFTSIEAPIKLDQNESGYDFPPELKQLALEKMLTANWNRYPDIHANRLRKQVAARVGWQEDGIVLTPGSNVLIHALAQAAGIGQRVLSVAPAFSLYGLSAQLLGANLLEPRLNSDFSLPMQDLLFVLEQPTPGVAYLAVPHAPTGAMPSLQEIETLVARADKNWLLVLDEAYFEYSGRNHIALLEQPNVCILRTFSKAWGLGGVRFGALLAQPDLVRQIQKVLSPFNVSLMIQCVIETALEHPEYVQTRVQETLAERARVFAALEPLKNWKVYPSAANFHLIRTPNATAAHAALLECGILVRKQDSYAGLEGCIRVSIGTPAENDAFIAAALELETN